MLKTALGAILILIGGILYLLFRPHTLLLFRVVEMLGFDPIVHSWRQHTLLWNWPEWAVYCLPDGLWSSGYVLIVEGLFLPHPYKWLVAGIIPVVGAATELLQWAGIMPGTFDVVDIVCYLLPYPIWFAATYPHPPTPSRPISGGSAVPFISITHHK